VKTSALEKHPTSRKFTLSFEKKILAYSSLLVIIIISMVVIYQSMSAKYKLSKKWVAHTENILGLTDKIELRQKDVVIGMRGFVITGNTSLLKFGSLLKDSIYKDLSELKRLTEADRHQAERVDSLRSLINKYFSLSNKALSIRFKKPFHLDEEILLIEDGNQTVEQMNALFHAIEEEGKSQLTERRLAYQDSLTSAVIAIRVLLVVFVLSLVIALSTAYNNTIKRNKIDKALRKSQGLIREIVEHAPVLVNIKDTAGRFILVNNQFASAMQTTPEQLVGKIHQQYLPKESADIISKSDEEIIKTGRASEIQLALPAQDGLHTYITSKFPLFDDKGRVYAIGAISADITPVKRAHESLEKSYERQQRLLNGLQEALSTSSDMICIINEDYEFVMVSDTSKALLGYSPKEMMSKKFMEFVAESDKDKTEQVACEILSGTPVSDFTNKYKKKDGSFIPLIWSAKWLPEDRMMYCIARNGTEKAKTAAQLAESESRLAHAQTIAKLGNWDWDLKSNAWTCSDEIYNLLGVDKNEELDIQQFMLNSIHPEDRSILLDIRSQAISQGKKVDVEHRIIRRGGEICFMHTKGEVSLDDNGTPTWFHGTMQNITDRKHAELELQKLNEDLEKRAAELKASNSELERFAYVASHDLQEPLRMVSSFLSLLQKKLGDDLDDASKKYVHFAIDGAERMKALIQDLLHYSRLGSSNELFIAVDLDDVLKNILRIYDNTIKEVNATVNVSALPTVIGNKTQLSQLFQNLLGNALKYRSDKRPIIEVKCQQLEGEWLFTVKDNGIGIGPKFFDKIFVIFQRLHNKNEYSGTGIGLAVCKKIVERHGGKIWVESSVDQGSTFHFTLKKEVHA
jgi:two-component system CheB/CheR fusion protein